MQPAHSAPTTPSTAGALGQGALGPATQETFAAQTATPTLSREEDSQNLIQPQDWKVEPIIRGNVSGFQNKSKKTLKSSQLPKTSIQKMFPEGLD